MTPRGTATAPGPGPAGAQRGRPIRGRGCGAEPGRAQRSEHRPSTRPRVWGYGVPWGQFSGAGHATNYGAGRVPVVRSRGRFARHSSAAASWAALWSGGGRTRTHRTHTVRPLGSAPRRTPRAAPRPRVMLEPPRASPATQAAARARGPDRHARGRATVAAALRRHHRTASASLSTADVVAHYHGAQSAVAAGQCAEQHAMGARVRHHHHRGEPLPRIDQGPERVGWARHRRSAPLPMRRGDRVAEQHRGHVRAGKARSAADAPASAPPTDDSHPTAPGPMRRARRPPLHPRRSGHPAKSVDVGRTMRRALGAVVRVRPRQPGHRGQHGRRGRRRLQGRGRCRCGLRCRGSASARSVAARSARLPRRRTRCSGSLCSGFGTAGTVTSLRVGGARARGRRGQRRRTPAGGGWKSPTTPGVSSGAKPPPAGRSLGTATRWARGDNLGHQVARAAAALGA